MVLALAALGVACRSQRAAEPHAGDPTQTSADVTAPGAQCSLSVPAHTPELPPPRKLPEVTSRIGARIDIQTSRIVREIEARVPRVLTSARGRNIGAPGKATYTVTRGTPRVGLYGTSLVVVVPVHADIEVCKPVGPLCVRYGRCSPDLEAKIELPLKIDGDLDLPPSRASSSAVKRCVIAGYDATPHLLEIADDELVNVRRQIDASIPDLKRWVTRAHREAAEPVRLDERHCLQWTPHGVELSRPALSKGTLSISASTVGTLELLPNCGANARSTDPLPRLRVDQRATVPDGVSARAARAIGWDVVQARIADDAARATQDGIVIERVTTHAVAGFGANALLLELRLAGRACGTAWLRVAPKYDASSRAAVLTDVSAEAPDAVPELIAALSKRLSAVRIPLPFDVAALDEVAAQRARDLETSVAQGRARRGQAIQGVAIDVQRSPVGIEGILVSESGLVAVAGMSGRARLSVE